MIINHLLDKGVSVSSANEDNVITPTKTNWVRLEVEFKKRF